MQHNRFNEELNRINTSDDFHCFINLIRPICANEKSSRINLLIDYAIKRSESFSDKRILVKLYDLKIRQLYSSITKLSEILKLQSRMHLLCEELEYDAGLALVFQLAWHIEKLMGNMEKSSEKINRAIEIVENTPFIEDYTKYFCFYSFAIENWLKNREFSSSAILEECVNYFYSNGYYHGLAMSLGVLTIIYQQTQNKEKVMKLIQKILSGEDLLIRIPREIQSIIHYFIGVGHKLCFNLNEAEKHFLESQNILKLIYKKSIYSGYYLTSLSHLTATYALQGKLDFAVRKMNEVQELMEEGIAVRNLDSFNKKQITHTFNLMKFYIKSRLRGFRIENDRNLVQVISYNIDKYHSNAIFFSEFLLNANLTKERLIEIRSFNNPSTKRVEHIINFLIAKTTHAEEQQIMNYISILKKRPVEDRMTFAEKAYADLLAAREYYKLNRFAEIYLLLKKYENNLHKIEVLEMRVFMEAFIQVGAYKNGDPLGPALQYMAIKKCRQYGFSRLENKLLKYLSSQGKDTFNVISKNC